jgi:hypothetical protein
MKFPDETLQIFTEPPTEEESAPPSDAVLQTLLAQVHCLAVTVHPFRLYKPKRVEEATKILEQLDDCIWEIAKEIYDVLPRTRDVYRETNELIDHTTRLIRFLLLHADISQKKQMDFKERDAALCGLKIKIDLRCTETIHCLDDRQLLMHPLENLRRSTHPVPVKPLNPLHKANLSLFEE